jgi:aminobenzoyl-glutamate transport protein
MKSKKEKSNRMIEKFLAVIEAVGNKLPHPTALFALFALGVIILSWLVEQVK